MLNEETAEFFGALFGDGCLSKYFSKSENLERHEIAFTGSADEIEYYKQTLQPIVYKNFGFTGRVFCRGDSSRFHIRVKKLFEFFESFGFPVGEKKGKLFVPEQITKSKRLWAPFLRGLFDTDGSIYRRYSGKCPSQEKAYLGYFVIQLKLASRAPVEQTKELLSFLGIESSKVSRVENAFVFRIGKQAAVARFLSVVGFSNPHHKTRIAALSKEFKSFR